MLALLLAVALIGLTVLALLLAGVVVAIVTGVLVLNACLLVLTLHRRPPAREPLERGPVAHEPSARWQPSSFRRPPRPPGEPQPASSAESESPPALRIQRL
jgi:hypothetical protein